MKNNENLQDSNLAESINNDYFKNTTHNNQDTNFMDNFRTYNNFEIKEKKNSDIPESNQENIKRKLLNEFGIIEKTEIKTFDYLDFMKKKSCSVYCFGEEPIKQKAFYCPVCDNKKGKKKNYICSHCYWECHQKCRNSLKEIPKVLLQKDNVNEQRFTCYCGSVLKHTFEVKKQKEYFTCTMMELDSILGISSYYCNNHKVNVCCICYVVCHEECKDKKSNINGNVACQCKSDSHSHFNELALTFPLENYKKVSKIDVWPVQILNILFSNGKTFNNMSSFFNKSMTLDIDFNSDRNIAIINKFKNLLELFSNTFNRKFKTYYYDQRMISTFEYEKLFHVISHLDANNGTRVIIKFRLLFILLFIHLRKDFRTIKSLTTNDFKCNNVLQRLRYKKLLKSKTILTEKIDEKYRIRKDFPVKVFVLKELCNLMTKGMNFISVEENQDEFEIGLKLISFMLKRLMFTREDLIILIDSITNFHSNFYDYIMKAKNNIYSLIDIFNAIVEICYLIAVNYNDLVIEEYLNNGKNAIGEFIHVKSEHSNKLLSIVLKNCDILTKHYQILIKPNLDKKSEEEQQRERKIQKHYRAMQERIASQTTGVTIKMPKNGGLLTDKIIFLHKETLSLFSLADNIYQKQLDFITDKEFEEHYKFCLIIEDEHYQDIMKCENEINNYSNNILYNMKLGLEEGYFTLFTSSYVKEEHELHNKLKNVILKACDNIKINIDNKCKEPYYNNLILSLQDDQNTNSSNSSNELEELKREILKNISVNINFAGSPFLLTEEGRELLVNNLIMLQVDESIFKGFFFLTNIRFPNIINHELVKLLFDFLSLFFLTKNGVMYILTGKNIQVIEKLINRFRFDEKNKNVNVAKHRTEQFNVKSIKVVIHYLCILSKFIRKLNIKTLIKHKALFKFKKSILTHLKYFVKPNMSQELLLEYKIQLKEGLEIFNNLFQEYDYNQYEEIKKEIIDIFKNNPLHFLSPKLFQQWFDKSQMSGKPNYMEIRKYDLDCYFHFFEILTKNSFYVYEKDEEGLQNIETLINFIDLENLSKLLIQSPELITVSQKTILLKFIRTFYLLDYLDPVNINKKRHLLTTNQYKQMVKFNFIENNNQLNYINQNSMSNVYKNNNFINNYNNQNNNIDKDFVDKQKYINKYLNKLKYIDKIIILIKFYIIEIQSFPDSVINENILYLKKYIKELIFATQEISTKIFYSKDVFNKILPHYYKLIVQFIKKKEIFIKILLDIQNNEFQNNPQNIGKYITNENKDYKYISRRDFNIFNKEELFKCAIKNIYDIYKITKINEEYCLQKYLEIYDVYNEANFPPFSLIEVYDYEYFYDGQNNKKEEIEENNKDNDLNEEEQLTHKLNILRENYLEQFRNISDTAFLSILSDNSSDKKNDFGKIYVNLFQSFINSTQSNSFSNDRTLLCIMTKMLFYDGEHIQELFNEKASDKYFFKNLNRELNEYIVQCIELSQKYELCSRCAEVTNMTKLTIQFLQLLGEGFNTKFHENILKGTVKEPEKKKLKNDKNNLVSEEDTDNDYESSSSDSDSELKEKGLVNENLEPIELANFKNENNLVEVNSTIFETAISNLKRIYHLMELNNLLEGESAFDKLCVLSTNIIDFIIEYLDTKEHLTHIIDNNIKKLFFEKEKDEGHITSYSYMDKNGILPIFTMKIKDNYDNEDKESHNKYKLRKTMLAYMQIKYFQLLKAYLQIGNKNDFVNLLLSEHLGPMQLYGEILYYMKELINNLIDSDYNKYNDLLNIDNVSSYIDKLKNLYMFEDDFRTSIEISVVFQICIIIATLEETYKKTMLRDHFVNEQIQDAKEDSSFNFLASDSNENIIEDSLNIEKNNNNITNFGRYEQNNYNIFNENNNINRYENENYQKQIESSDNNLFKESNVNFNVPTELETLNKIDLLQQNDNNEYDNIKLNYKEKNKNNKRNSPKIPSINNKKILGDEYINLNSTFSKAIYRFLHSLVSRVEIKNEEKRNNFDVLTYEITKKVVDFKNGDIILSNIINDDIEGNNLDNNKDNEPNYEENDEEENDNNDNEDDGKQLVFFIKPYLSFHLSEQAKVYFLNNVDRSSDISKYQELISYCDYFIFEMMYNMKYINNSVFLKMLSKISFYALEVVNYLLILAENCLLMYHYYRDYSLSYDEYEHAKESIRYKRFSDIIIIIVVKLILIFFTFFIWFYCKFIITYQRNVMIKEDKNFIFRQLGQHSQNIINPIMVKYFRENGNLSETMSLINEDIGIFKKIKLGVIDSIIFNLDINIFVFSFVLDVLFLGTGHPLFLSIEVLFLYGIFPSLINIFKSFTAKFSSLCSCLLFTYLILYVYNYIAIFYMRDACDLGEVMEYDSETYVNEPFCHSSIQHFLVLISYGTRAGGGIGDVLPHISYRYDLKMFIGRFFYDMTFFIIIIMIMGNVTFGLIVDTFGALRDETYQYENDRTNKCFICQLDTDSCLIKNIDYEKHIKRDHNLWNYVDFMTYLHLYNVNDFTRIEGSVWDKLLEKDYGWIPIDPDAGNNDDDDD